MTRPASQEHRCSSSEALPILPGDYACCAPTRCEADHTIIVFVIINLIWIGRVERCQRGGGADYCTDVTANSGSPLSGDRCLLCRTDLVYSAGCPMLE